MYACKCFIIARSIFACIFGDPGGSPKMHAKIWQFGFYTCSLLLMKCPPAITFEITIKLCHSI